MAFIAYLPRAFERHHENVGFRQLVDLAEREFTAKPGLNILIGNVLIDGNELDAILLKPSGIAVIELKSHSGEVIFNENSAWQVGRARVAGGRKPNPYLQVRAYRYAVANYLAANSRRFLLRERIMPWINITGVVLFTSAITFDENTLPRGHVRVWFHVKHLGNIAPALNATHPVPLSFDDDELRKIVGLMGLGEEQRFRVSLPEQSGAQAVPNQPAKVPLTLIYVREFPFREDELRMRSGGGACSIGALRVRNLFDKVREGVDPFEDFPFKEVPGIEGARIYAVSEACELVLLRLGAVGIPAFLGTPKEVEAWLQKHEGLTVTIDESTKRVSITRVSTTVEPAKLNPPVATAENVPFLRRLSNLKVEELVPQVLARKSLLALDETSTESDIGEVLEIVQPDDVRQFLFDIVNLVRAGDLSGAEARVRLRSGEGVPAQDAGQFASASAAADVNSDQVIVINSLSKEELDQLLDPANFRDWMLFLHPDQRALVEAEFDRPVVLKGVSGSGKTCILVHRAKFLARKYPGQRIGILTLSGSLARLIENLVTKLCSEEDRKNIVVQPFYAVFREYLERLGPQKYFDQVRDLVGNDSEYNRDLDRVEAKWPKGMV